MTILGPNSGYYKARFNRIIPITPSLIEAGMICVLNYYSLNEDGSRNAPKDHLVLVLNSGQRLPDLHLHAIKLTEINGINFNRLVTNTGLEFHDKMESFRKVKIPKLLMEDRFAKNFYVSYLKGKMTNFYENSYRTYFRKNIVKCFAIDFKFNNTQTKKLIANEMKESIQQQKQNPGKFETDKEQGKI